MQEAVFVNPRFPELIITVEPARYADRQGNKVKSKHLRFARGPMNWGVLRTSNPDEIKLLRNNADFLADVMPGLNSQDSGIFEVTDAHLKNLEEQANLLRGGNRVVRGPLTSATMAPHAPLEPAPHAPAALVVPRRGRSRK